MRTPASGPVQLTKQEVELLECLYGYGVTSCRGGGIAWSICDGGTFEKGRLRVEWLLDAYRVVWLLELGAEMAATGEGPAVFDRAAFLLGWRFEDDQDQDGDGGAVAPSGEIG